MIMFAAAEAETEKAAIELLTRGCSVLKLVASTDEETVKNFARNKNTGPQCETWVVFRINVSTNQRQISL